MAIKEKLPSERLGLVLLAALVVAGGTYAVVKGQRQPSPIVFNQGSPATSSTSGSAAAQNNLVIVHVTGAVVKSGVFHLAAGARVDDAIKAAGGAKVDADLESLNLAAKLVDGSQVFVPIKAKANPLKAKGSLPDLAPKSEIEVVKRGKKPVFEPYRGGTTIPPYKVEIVPDPSATKPKEPSSPHRTAKKEAPQSPVSLNSATLEQLEALPGVGPATAQKIIDYRKEHGGFKTIDEIQAVKGIGPKKFEAMRKYLQL